MSRLLLPHCFFQANKSRAGAQHDRGPTVQTGPNAPCTWPPRPARQAWPRTGRPRHGRPSPSCRPSRGTASRAPTGPSRAVKWDGIEGGGRSVSRSERPTRTARARLPKTPPADTRSARTTNVSLKEAKMCATPKTCSPSAALGPRFRACESSIVLEAPRLAWWVGDLERGGSG